MKKNKSENFFHFYLFFQLKNPESMMQKENQQQQKQKEISE